MALGASPFMNPFVDTREYGAAPAPQPINRTPGKRKWWEKVGGALGGGWGVDMRDPNTGEWMGRQHMKFGESLASNPLFNVGMSMLGVNTAGNQMGGLATRDAAERRLQAQHDAPFSLERMLQGEKRQKELHDALVAYMQPRPRPAVVPPQTRAVGSQEAPPPATPVTEAQMEDIWGPGEIVQEPVNPFEVMAATPMTSDTHIDYDHEPGGGFQNPYQMYGPGVYEDILSAPKDDLRNWLRLRRKGAQMNVPHPPSSRRTRRNLRQEWVK